MFWIFYTIFVWNLSHSKNSLEKYNKYRVAQKKYTLFTHQYKSAVCIRFFGPLCIHRSHVKYPLFVSDFNDTWIFPTDL
jgi:hypothetical protein